MTTFGERIEIALSRKGRSKSWLSEQIGLSKQALHYVITQASRPKYVSEIAIALNIDSMWLATGEGEIEFYDSLGVGKKIPLLNSSTIDFRLNNTVAHNIKNFITVDSLEPDDTFAFLLENKSMEPLFSMGTILLFRENKSPSDGNFVLCILERNKEIVFRQYYKDGSGTYLNPINPVYKTTLDEPYKILGTLIESRNRYS